MESFLIKDSRDKRHINHPSTHATLALLESLVGLKPMRVLDIGAGSGILSFWAAAHWPNAHILAGDIRALAVTEMQENIALNHLQTRIACVQAEGFDHPKIKANAPYDLIMANLIAHWHVRYMQEMAHHLAADGVLILSGILAWRMQEITAALAHAKLNICAQFEIDNWYALHCTSATNIPT